ncbi:bifunctional diguanylate cyclase/phosphodiesterase [Acinetobacter pecorum]|uniref:EAL domain-containing protein n=1 Tax=Acinetobacter pecorum TaxID=2762215 RepID=A0ABR8VVY3_9GAMM|nr:EAL domain-containing protein [Acinetobacter pecorum]MBD8008926.1 EAL domain-containing protein [Acinetobacter pecorum]
MHNNCDDQDIFHIFNLIGRHTELKPILDIISQWLESRIPEALVTIMLYREDTQTLNVISGQQHFSKEYCNVIQDLKIAPDRGTCGVAAFLRQLVISPNLMKDPNWQSYRAVVNAEKLSSCWSMPIINASDILYGTFSTYYRAPKIPTEQHIELLQQAAKLVALAIELDQERQKRQELNEKYCSFYTYHPHIIFELDLQGHMLTTNIACEEITGFSKEQICGQHYCAFIPPEFHELANFSFIETLQGKSQHFELPIYNVTGDILWLDLTNLPIIQNQKVTGVIGIARDITLSRKNKEDLRLLKRGVEASPNSLFITDVSEERLMVYVNPAFLKLTGYTETEVLGQGCFFLQGPDTDPDQISLLKQAVKKQKEIQVTIKSYCKDGSWFWNRLTLGPIFDQTGTCTHFLGIQEDITQQLIHEEYIRHQHTHDYLTGLPNQHAFKQILENIFEVQHESSEPLVLLYIDLDDFKNINDSLGHLVGDQILKSVGERLQKFIQDDNVLCRFAEDEFILLLSGIYESSEVEAIAGEILELLSILFVIDQYKIHLSASIGIVADDSSIQHSSELIYQSVLAMQEAKRQGRNIWQWYEKNKMQPVAEIDYTNLRLELMEAINQENFDLFYQPLVHPETGHVTGVEALIRWCHPQQGYISPAIFIPLAERTGQIISVGQWVLEKACLDIAHWNKKHNSQITVSVNISPLQFRRAGFLQVLEHALQLSQLPPELLKIEITEGVIINGADRTIEILKAVRALGVQVAIDDFGTGYSSLSYLRRLPINQIKLDRSFIEELTLDGQDAAIVQSIIHLAHQLDLEVVAEGVETLSQASLLYQQGCDLLQGFFYAKPAPLTELKSVYLAMENSKLN